MRQLSCLLAAILISIFTTISTQAQENTASAPLPASNQSSADQARALVDVLKSDKARDALINELEKIAQPNNDQTTSTGSTTSGGETASGTDANVAANQPAQIEEKVSIGRQLAEFTKQTSESFAESLSTLGERLSKTGNTLGSLGGSNTANVLWDALLEMAIIIVVTYAVFYGLRFLSLPFFRMMGRRSEQANMVKTGVSVAVSVLVDLGLVIAAWALGYIIAIYFLGINGQIGIRQTLYLNAFLIVEIVKVACRTVLSPSTDELRWINISDEAARHFNRGLTLLVSVIGYGHLLVLPIVNRNISANAGTAMALLVALVGLGIALYMVMRNRKPVAGWLLDEKNVADEGRSFWHNLATHWHYPVIFYLGFLFILVVTRPEDIMMPVLAATGKIILAILAGMVVVRIISRTLTNGIQMPERVNSRLPLLENRLNRFVPAILLAIKAIVFAFVAITLADVVGLFDISGWLQTQVGAQATASIISTLLILAVAFMVWLAMSSWIDYRLNPEVGKVPTSREITLLSLFRNAGTIAILLITLMFALSELGVDIAPLIASAGVLGLAIGFGAQKLVQDIITGIFIQFESAINVGDVITLNDTTGTVERLTIRSVSLRDVQGAYHIIPFSSVDMVTNYMREFSYFLCDMGVAYREDTEEVRAAMLDAFEELKQDETHSINLLADMEWMGVQSFGDNAVVVRSRVKTSPGKQWGIGRAYNAIVKRIFDERGIEMPFPHRTVYFGEDKEGKAPSAPLEIEMKRPPRKKRQSSAK